MNKAIIFVVVLLVAIGAALAIALGMQLKVNGEQKTKLDTANKALKSAETLRSDAEKAVAIRDSNLIKIKSENRRLSDEITKATKGNACADQPIPVDLDVVLCQLSTGAGSGVPAADAAQCVPNPAVGRQTWGVLAGWTQQLTEVIKQQNDDRAAEAEFCK